MRSRPLTLALLLAAAACSSSSTTTTTQDKDGGNTEPKTDAGNTTDGGKTGTDGGNTGTDGGNTGTDGGKTGTDGGSTGDGGGTTPDGGTKTDGGTKAGWTQMTLTGDHDSDTVSAIFYSSPTNGFVATVPGEDANAGAVFAASATKLGAIVFDGDVDTSAGGVLGGLEFWGLLPTPTGGLVAVTDLSDLVSAPSFTGAFTNTANGANLGIGQVAGAYFGKTFTILAQDQNGFEKTSGSPGASASYTDIYDPGSDPTVPSPIPAADCADALMVNDSFNSGLSAVAFSTDGNTIAYTTYNDADGLPEVCVSTNGGQAFLPFEFMGLPEQSPSGIIFPNPAAPSTIITYSGSLTDPTSNFVMLSTDTGKTFAPVTLPSGFLAKELQLFGAFFLADGMNGWIVGYDGDADTGLALVTTDGGKTWTVDATGLAAATPSSKLHSVFALDTSHLWIGGEGGTLVAYTP